MKHLSFIFLGLSAILARAESPLTLVQFVDPTVVSFPAFTTTITQETAVPIGVKGGETTYLIHAQVVAAVPTTIDGVATIITSNRPITQTYVVSALGFSVVFPESTSTGGPTVPLEAECHFTAADAGECVLAAPNNSTTLVTTRTGTPFIEIIPVSGNVDGAAPTGGGDGGLGPASGTGTGNGTGGGIGGTGNNSAPDVAPGKLVGVVFGGLVLGVLAVLG